MDVASRVTSDSCFSYFSELPQQALDLISQSLEKIISVCRAILLGIRELFAQLTGETTLRPREVVPENPLLISRRDFTDDSIVFRDGEAGNALTVKAEGNYLLIQELVYTDEATALTLLEQARGALKSGQRLAVFPTKEQLAFFIHQGFIVEENKQVPKYFGLDQMDKKLTTILAAGEPKQPWPYELRRAQEIISKETNIPATNINYLEIQAQWVTVKKNCRPVALMARILDELADLGRHNRLSEEIHSLEGVRFIFPPHS